MESAAKEPHIELVFHPIGHTDPPSTAFMDAARSVLSTSEGELRIVGPYLGHAVLGVLVQGRRFRLVTDLDACFGAGVDPALLALLKANLKSVRDLEDVHAKVLLNEGAALTGSANFTSPGFAGRDELGCLIREPELLAKLRAWFESLWVSATPVDAAQLDAFAERGRQRAASAPALPPGLGDWCQTSAPRLSGGTGPARRPCLLQNALHFVVGPNDDPDLSRSEILRASFDTSLLERRRRRADRALGLTAPRTTPASNHAAPEELDERAELAALLRRITRSREQTEGVLALLGEVLQVAGLEPGDERLHLNLRAKAGRLAITVVQRYVGSAFGGQRRGFGFILDDATVQARAIARAPQHAWGGSFKEGNGRDARPRLKVELEHLDAVLLDDVRESWHRAIRAEVARTTKTGRPPRSSYLGHERPALYTLLTDPDARRELASLVHTARSWWFGVNQGSGGHMQMDRVRPFLSGLTEDLVWPIGHSKPKRLYSEMRAGDRVLLWMGHGKKEAQWGFLGTASIVEARDDLMVLGRGLPFARPFTPYPKGQPTPPTEEASFLRELLGEDFAPLGDVMRAVFGTRKRNPITVAAVPGDAFDALVARATGR